MKKSIKITSFIFIIFCTLTSFYIPSNEVDADVICSYLFVPEDKSQPTVELIIETDDDILTKDEIDLIALVTMAEAEGESEYGKRLVIDTILNRLDHQKYPNSIDGVIYQPYQFTSMSNGRVNQCYVRNDICELVKEELRSRTNYDCIYFRTGCYSSYGIPLFKVGNHYFSSYK